MISLDLIDYLIIGSYFILLAYIGFRVKAQVHNLNDYFLAGRRLTLPIFVATLVSTWYGGILGVVELSYNYGLVNWITQGFFWYLSYLFFAFFLSKKIQKSQLYTVPDQLARFYDNRSRFLGAIFNFLMVSPAPYVLSLGVIANLIFGWPIWLGIIVGAIFMLFYTLRGGFYGVIYTDVIQFILMMGGVLLVIPFAISHFGGFNFLNQNLPETHLTFAGTWTTQMILVWGFIALWTLVDPGFYQRCYAAKDSSIPKKGILISILFWIIFDIATTTIGLYARAAFPEINPVTALPIFASSILPLFFKGLFFTGLLATIMSTIDSFTFLGAMNISHDLYHKYFRPQASEKEIMRVTKFGIIASSVLSVCLALCFDSIISIFYTIGTIGISAMLIPLLIGFFYKGYKSSTAAFYSMIGGSLVATTWLVNGYLNQSEGWPMYWWNIEPMYPGLVVSLSLFIIINLIFVKIKCFSPITPSARSQ